MKKLTLAEMQSIAQERGGLCLSENYEGSKEKLRWRCAKGHEWNALPSSIKRGAWCRKCASEKNATNRRISLEEIRALAKSRSGECLSQEYTKNKNTKLEWRCSEGHVWQATLGKVRNEGSWCPTCARLKQSLTLDDMKAIAREKGGECLSNVYLGSKIKLHWRCANGHEWDAFPGDIRNKGSWCPNCSGNAPLELKELQMLARSRGGECLASGKVRSTTKVQWQCAKGHKWMARPADVKHKDSWCPKCKFESNAARNRTPMDEIQALAHSRGGTCLSTSYENSKTNLRWRCARGHKWDASLRNVKHGSWCPICSAGVSERICRGIFEELFQTKFPKVRPEWLKNDRGNWMELDGYSEELNVAFEYQGIQHFEAIPFFHSKNSSLSQRQRDDKKRAELCRDKSIQLFEIPFSIPYHELEDFIREESRKRGVSIPYPNRVNIEEIPVYQNGPLEELRKLAIEKGGECLSTVYVNKDTKLKWRCSEGHEWEMTAGSVKNSGQWCPRCGINKRSEARKLSIQDMQMLAQSRGGTFLSMQYDGVGKKHRWRCLKGHEWDATPTNIKNGSWCPICAGRKPK